MSERIPVSRNRYALDELIEDENFAVAALDQYLLLVWRREVTLVGAVAATDAMVRLYERYPTVKLGFITLIDDHCSLGAPAEVRSQMALMLKNHNFVIGGAAIAYERSGFWSAIVRSVITAINVSSRAAFPSDVSASLDDAVTFVAQALGDNSDPHRQSVISALQKMRGEATAAVSRARQSARAAKR